MLHPVIALRDHRTTVLSRRRRCPVRPERVSQAWRSRRWPPKDARPAPNKTSSAHTSVIVCANSTQRYPQLIAAIDSFVPRPPHPARSRRDQPQPELFTRRSGGSRTWSWWRTRAGRTVRGPQHGRGTHVLLAFLDDDAEADPVARALTAPPVRRLGVSAFAGHGGRHRPPAGGRRFDCGRVQLPGTAEHGGAGERWLRDGASGT